MCYIGVFIPGLTVFNWGHRAAQRDLIRDMDDRPASPRGRGQRARTGSDAAALRTLAGDRGDHFLVNGQKMWCTGARAPGHHDRHLRPHRPRRPPSTQGVSLLLIDPYADGVEIRRTPTLARHILGTNEVFLADVVVPRGNLVGPLDEGWKVMLSDLELEKVIITGGYVGAAQSTLDEMLAFAKERRAFGRPIGTFQALAHAMADLQVEIDSARLLAYRAAWLLGQRPPCGREGSMAKLKGSETYVAAARLGHAGVRRARLLDRERHELPVPRVDRGDDLGWHQPDPAQRDRPEHGPAELLMLRVGIRPPLHLLERGVGLLQRSMAMISAAGLDHVTVGDHVTFRGGAGSDGLLQSTALAVAAPELDVHTGVYLLPLRHPVVVARQIATLAQLAPGRFVFGCGVGGEDRAEVLACGIDPATRGRRMDEAVAILRALLAGERVTLKGEFFDLEDVAVLPKPPEPVPIIVGGRSEVALRRAGRHGDGWIGVWVSPGRYAIGAGGYRRRGCGSRTAIG